MNTFTCENCHKEEDTLYELWVYSSQKNNPWAKGTASAGLLQKRVLCLECVRIAYDNGLTRLEERP